MEINMANNLESMKNPGPGDFIRDELEYRGWTQEDLAVILELDPKHISFILNNKQPLTFEVAQALGKIFGQSTQYWVNLDTLYRIGLENQSQQVKSAEIRSNIYKYMPIREMVNRGWLPEFSDTDELVEIVKKFWGIKKIDFKFLDNMILPNLRKSTAYNQFNIYYTLTWLNMVKIISKKIKVISYSPVKLNKIIESFHLYTISENGICEFLRDLNSAGIKFIELPHLQKTYIDGAVYSEKCNKVVAYTGRHNRLDNFWFTMAHELSHITLHLDNKDRVFIDNFNELNTDEEKEADKRALNLLKEKEVMKFFKLNKKYISKKNILECRNKYNINPSIIVGILQHNGILSRTNLNRFKEKVIEQIPDKYKWNASRLSHDLE